MKDRYLNPFTDFGFKKLFGSEPTLILMDELSIYLRKLKAKEREHAGGQLTAFLTSLFKAIESLTTDVNDH